MAKATAAPTEAPSNPSAAAPKRTPTANPSGMLCRVMASTRSVDRCQSVLGPSASSCRKLMCKCGVNLSKPKINSAPNPKPIEAGMTLANPSPPDISIAGESNDQKLAATITPPVNPNILSNHFRCMSLKNKTSDAPAAVMNQVKNVAKSAASSAPSSDINATSSFMILGFHYLGWSGWLPPTIDPLLPSRLGSEFLDRPSTPNFHQMEKNP